jgi:hypothetical protein
MVNDFFSILRSTASSMTCNLMKAIILKMRYSCNIVDEAQSTYFIYMLGRNAGRRDGEIYHIYIAHGTRHSNMLLCDMHNITLILPSWSIR